MPRMKDMKTWICSMGMMLLLSLVTVPALTAEEGLLPPIRLEPNQLSSFMTKVVVKSFRFQGNRVLSAEELSRITAPYENREITTTDLETMRRELTLAYVQKGFVSSGVIIPDQRVDSGVIELVVVEGQLAGIEVKGNEYFRSEYIQERLARAAHPVVNVFKLQEELLLFEQDSRISRITGDLKPGLKQGESILEVGIKENSPWKLGLELSNTVSPSIGGTQGKIFFGNQNLTGNGDVWTMSYARAQGITDNWDFSYALPLTVYDTTLRLYYTKMGSTILEGPFKDLSLEAVTEAYGIELRQPIIKRYDREFTLGLAGEHRQSKIYLMGRPFAFEGGSDDGKTAEVPLRFFQEFRLKSQAQVLSFRSTFSKGTANFDATTNTKSPDGRFFAWMGQVQWLTRLFDTDWQLFFRTDFQLSAVPLLSMEKFSVGGLDSVRGYRQNLLVRDNGLASSVEMRIPLLLDGANNRGIFLVPFFDYGQSWNKEADPPGPQSIYSVGLGFRAHLKNRLIGEFFWGLPLRDAAPTKSDLQDQGFHFRCIINFL